MTLSRGARLGPHEVLSWLGAGTGTLIICPCIKDEMTYDSPCERDDP